MFQAVIFDLDGTLLNTLEDLAAAGNYALRQAGLPEHPVQAYRYFVGNGIPRLIERITGENGDKREQVHRSFLAYYGEHKEDRTRPYLGILELLDSLRERGIRLGVVSNKDDGAVKSMIRSYFGDRFQVVLGRRDGLPPKPDPGLVQEALHSLAVPPEETLYVGDSSVDILTAKAAGTASCGVLWDFRTEEELREAGAERLAADPSELLHHILS